MLTKTLDRTTLQPQTRPLTLRAEPLQQLAALWWRVREHPQDRGAKIQLALAHKEGLDRCPACREALRLEGHRITMTPYGRRETLGCGSCQTEWVLCEQHAA